MASTCKCEYCGSIISTQDQICPNCGASNPGYVIDTQKIVTDPQTIEELKEYCAERGMPLARMRFFIGEDFKEPKAFGIFRDSRGDIVVYKNKADGTRAVRYKGPDERHAVNEIYGKLLQECHNRGIYPDGKSNTPSMTRSSSYNGNSSADSYENARKVAGCLKYSGILIPLILALIFIIIFIIGSIKHPNGYYKYDDTMYYLKGSTWFYYDDYTDDWYGVSNSVTDSIYDNGRTYYQEDEWDSSWGESIYDSDAYREYEESHYSSSSDSDSDYDSYDDWDSGSTDWDSDW